MVNFRNIKKKRFTFADSITYIYGKNGAGKTNLIEAIYYLSCGRSFRSAKDNDMEMKGEKYFHLNGTVLKNTGKHEISFGVETGVKKITVDNEEIKRISDLFGLFVPIVFSPDDIRIIGGAPSVRRRFIDRMIASVDVDYIRWLKKYNYALEERNKLLRGDSDKDENLFYAYEKMLIENGIEIAKRRNEAVDLLNKTISEIYSEMTGVADDIFINYNTKFLNIRKDELHLHYREKRENDRFLKRTSLGIHKDDIKVLINGEDSRYFASTGEKKSVVLAIRIAEADMYHKSKKDYPVILLDDVFSELDESRKEKLFNYFIGKAQVIITSPERYDMGKGVKYLNMETE